MAEALLPLAGRVSTAKGWDSTMREIMLASKALPVLAEAQRIDENKIAGCLSQVWLATSEPGVLQAWSDSKIIRGVLAVLIEKACEDRPMTAEDYQQYLVGLGLERYLSESRTSGIRHVIQRLVSIR